MRWFVMSVLVLALALPLLWWLIRSPDSETDVRPGASDTPHVATSSRPAREAKDAPVPRYQAPTLPEDARIQLDPIVRQEPEEEWSTAELAMKRQDRKKFHEAFEEFATIAQLSDQQLQDVLFVLYDFQENMQAAREVDHEALAKLEEDEPALFPRITMVVHNERMPIALDQLNTILTPYQMGVWRRIAMHRYHIFVLLSFDRPLVLEDR